jgi:hypothetical protein
LGQNSPENSGSYHQTTVTIIGLGLEFAGANVSTLPRSGDDTKAGAIRGGVKAIREFDLNIERVLKNWTVAHALREVVHHRSGEWQELLDVLIASLARTQTPITSSERDELRTLAKAMDVPADQLSGLNVQG